MKKKIINGIMMVALVAATSTSFVSCKDTNEDVRVEMQAEYATLLGKLNALEDKYGDLDTKISTLENKVKNMAGDIETLQKEVDELELWLIETFNNLVTSVELAGTYNNMTGRISAPGFEPMMLISNYGTAAEAGVFPSVKDKNGNQISWAQNEELGSGKDMKINMTEDGDINVTLNGGFAGYIYANVNRYNNTTLQDSNFDEESLFSLSLVNTAGEAVDGLVIANVEKDGNPTNDVLEFGWTRAANNTFKFAVAYAGDKAKKLEPYKIDLSKFKDDLKAVWANRDKSTGTSKEALGHLAADLYYNLATKQYNLPKYALKIKWQDKLAKAAAAEDDAYKADAAAAFAEGGDGDVIKYDASKEEKVGIDHFVTSKSEILFATFKPIGFNSGEVFAEKVGQYVNNVNTLVEKAEYIENKIFDRIKAQLPAFNNFAGANVAQKGGKYVITIPAADLAAAVGGAGSYNDLDVDVDDIVRPLNLTIDQVNDMMTQARALKDKLNGSTITNWVKKFTNKFNTLIDNNASQMLQPTLLAIAKDGTVNRVSGLKAAPFVAEGEIRLEPTSYTAEIFAPAYAKYVGCDKITEDGFNEIRFANDSKLKFTPKSGETYEIVYEAVDFFGNTFKHTYYIQGK